MPTRNQKRNCYPFHPDTTIPLLLNHKKPQPKIKTLLDLPELCLILIFSRIPLSTLLLAASVCSRFNSIKRKVCARQSKLTLSPYPQLVFNNLSCFVGNKSAKNEITFLDISLNPTYTLFTPHRTFRDNINNIRTFIIYRKLQNLAKIFPNITSLTVYKLEVTFPSDNQYNYIETYVERLTTLIYIWAFKLTHLTLVINEAFFNSKLVTVVLELPNLSSLAIDLGAPLHGLNDDNLHIDKLLSLISKTQITKLSIGKIENLNKIRSLISSILDSTNKIEDLKLFLSPNDSGMALFDVNNRNLDRKLVLSRLYFDVTSYSSLRDLKLLGSHFTGITHLQLLITLKFEFPTYVFVEFSHIIKSLTSFKQLKTLEITTLAVNKFDYKIIFPSRYSFETNLPELPSVQHLHLYIGENRTLTQISQHQSKCICGAPYRFIYGTIECSLAHMFPNVRTITVNRPFNLRINLNILALYCFISLVLDYVVLVLKFIVCLTISACFIYCAYWFVVCVGYILYSLYLLVKYLLF